jgi:hypothetical protein
MANDQYLRGIFDKFGYLATWLPNKSVKLGDVGEKRGREFDRRTSLDNLSIDFNVRQGDRIAQMSHSSSSGVSVSFKAAGEAAMGTLPVDKAGAVVEFGRDGAFVFEANNCVVFEIDDKVELGREVIRRYLSGDWDKNWSVIDQIVKVDRATILVSNHGNARLELSATKDLKAGAVDLAKADAGLSATFKSGDITQFLAEENLNPMFRLSRIKRSLFDWFTGKEPTFEGVRRADFGDEPDLPDEVLEQAFEPVGLDDEEGENKPE